MTEALRVCVGHRAATHTEVGTDGLLYAAGFNRICSLST